jgi:hypothetical protein
MNLCLVLGAALVFLSGCSAGEDPASGAAEQGGSARTEAAWRAGRESPGLDPRPALDRIAETERAGGFAGGMGLAESRIREDAGDHAGAVIAAYKELAWAYGFALVREEELFRGLGNVLALEGEAREEKAAAGALIAFLQGRWDEAEAVLLPLYDRGEDPDSFIRWMLLVCGMEKARSAGEAGELRALRGAYASIRARYENFPEYWYRGARLSAGETALSYAEHCIALAPEGPFSGACRIILAESLGLGAGDGGALKCRNEIEDILIRSVSAGEPGLLAPLFPLIALPDNVYTVYAVGAMRALAARPLFRDYFSKVAEQSSGRLAERLGYICRG